PAYLRIQYFQNKLRRSPAGCSICKGDLIFDKLPAFGGVERGILQIGVEDIAQLGFALSNAACPGITESFVRRPVSNLFKRERIFLGYIPAARDVDHSSDDRR